MILGIANETWIRTWCGKRVDSYSVWNPISTSALGYRSYGFFLWNAVNKQLNDKERVAAALENPNLVEMVDECLSPSFEWCLDALKIHYQYMSLLCLRIFWSATTYFVFSERLRILSTELGIWFDPLHLRKDYFRYSTSLWLFHLFLCIITAQLVAHLFFHAFVPFVACVML